MSKTEEMRGLVDRMRESMATDLGAALQVGAPRPAVSRGKVLQNAKEVPLDLIEADPGQPRTIFDPEDLDHLASSLQRFGLLQPIRVRWVQSKERYVIVCGERRFRAAQMAGLATIPCVVHDDDDPATLVTIQLIENLVRSDLQPIEKARAFRRLMEGQRWTVRQLADELDIAASSVTRYVRLLELPEDVQARVNRGEITPSAAYELSKLEPDQARELAAEVVSSNLPHNQVVEQVQVARVDGPHRPSSPRSSVRTRRRPAKWEFRTPEDATVTVCNADGPAALKSALRQALKGLARHSADVR